jgi:hypothetical protein
LEDYPKDLPLQMVPLLKEKNLQYYLSGVPLPMVPFLREKLQYTFKDVSLPLVALTHHDL